MKESKQSNIRIPYASFPFRSPGRQAARQQIDALGSKILIFISIAPSLWNTYFYSREIKLRHEYEKDQCYITPPSIGYQRKSALFGKDNAFFMNKTEQRSL